MSLRIGETFAGYRVLRLLGSGGMGEVYVVQHPRLPRQDALKVLRPDISSDGSFRERFIREADLAAGLRHQHIVGIHDRGEHDGQLWIAMDYIDGIDTAELIQQRYPAGMPVEVAIPLIVAVASALDYAHRKGLLHRDVKPANIILTDPDSDDDRAYLADFGIARPLDDSSSITTTNMTVGTVAYAAPEQLMGEQMDGRADQYALAATAYHLLTGLQLFPHTNPAVVISQHLNTDPPALGVRRPECASLDEVMQIALAKNPADRFTTCTAFAQALADESPGRGPASAIATTRAAPQQRRSAATMAAKQPDLAAVRPMRIWGVLGGCVAAILLIVVVGVLWRPWQHSQSDSTVDSSSSAPSRSTPTAAATVPSTSVAPQPPPTSNLATPPEGYFTDARRAFSGWNNGQGIPDTSGSNRVLTEVFDWVCQHQDADPDVVNRQIQMQETWFNHPSLELYEANRLRSIAMSYCPRSSAAAPVPTTATAPVETSPMETSPSVAYDSVCSFLHGQGDQWPDGPYLHRWMLERYPDLPSNQVDNILDTAFQDPACQGPG